MLLDANKLPVNQKKHVGSCTHTGLHVHPRRFARSPEHNPGSLFHAPKSRFCRGQSLFVCLFAFHTADLSFHNTPWVSKIPAFSVLPPRVKVVLAGLLTKFSRCRGSNVSPLGPREARMDTCMSDTPRNHGCAEENWCSHRAFRLQLGLGRPVSWPIIFQVYSTYCRVGGVDAYCNVLNGCWMYRTSAHNRWTEADPTHMFFFLVSLALQRLFPS